MRLLIIIFSLLPYIAYGQSDSVVLQFAEADKTINKAQKITLEKYCTQQTVQVHIKAYIGSDQSISQNRINTIFRINALNEYFQAQALPNNAITTERILTNDINQFNKIVLSFKHLDARAKDVLYKSSTIEILDRGTPGKKHKLKKKKRKKNKKPTVVKTYGKYRIDEFRKGQKIVIPELIFYATRHIIERGSMRSLNHLVAIMKDRPTLIIQLQGHICCKTNGEDGMDFGTDTPNLSENRALAVCKYLIEHGIDARRLSYVGFGSKFKRVPDGGDYGRGRLNRRVEIFVISE